ncbi:MAG: hypothetical protein AUI16_21435 [Alphaproteobacteria bacterium 13_2_20CM_2_64_7]|jgi:excisionase family DNA binding protein|nr:MAG: hypothetical protein AUI16_21435 [Alphaproteobacteria bacterium 13_2_20CM_2_64_7]
MNKRKRRCGGMRTGEEFAERLGIGRNQAYEALQAGKVKGAIRYGRRWLIPDAVIDQILAGEAAAAEIA